MPRYFFTIRQSEGDFEDDPFGTILPNASAALSHAESMIRTLQNRGRYNDPGLMMFVKDESGQTVLSLPLVPAGD